MTNLSCMNPDVNGMNREGNRDMAEVIGTNIKYQKKRYPDSARGRVGIFNTDVHSRLDNAGGVLYGGGAEKANQTNVKPLLS